MKSPRVHGLDSDPETRCTHYRTSRDIVAIKMKCCGEYYACKDCHYALAGHDIQAWPRHCWHELAVLCGHCRTELSIEEYMASGHRCPACGAEFNPGCSKHYGFYFDVD